MSFDISFCVMNVFLWEWKCFAVLFWIQRKRTADQLHGLAGMKGSNRSTNRVCRPSWTRCNELSRRHESGSSRASPLLSFTSLPFPPHSALLIQYPARVSRILNANCTPTSRASYKTASRPDVNDYGGWFNPRQLVPTSNYPLQKRHSPFLCHVF